jgi:parallel beta-helix repeat protein
MHFANARRVTAAYNWVENTGDDGMAVVETVDQKWLDEKTPRADGNRFLFNTLIGVRWGRGILTGGRGMTVAGNWVEGTVFPGIYTESSSLISADTRPPIENAQIIGNTLVRNDLGVRPDNGLTGYDMRGSLQLSGILDSALVSGNRVFAAQNNGIAIGVPINTRAGQLAVADNVVTGSQKYGLNALLKDGFRVERLSLHGNRFAGNLEGEIQTDARVPVVQAPPQGRPALQAKAPEIPVEMLNRFAAAQKVADETGWMPAPTVRSGLPVVEARAYGARGDGRTNDTAAILRALAAVPASGGVLHFASGTYRIEPVPGRDTLADTRIPHHLLVADRDNVQITGDGAASVLLFTSSDHTGLRLLNVRNAEVRNLTLRLESPPDYPKNRPLLDIAAAEGVRVTDVKAQSAAGAGIQVDSSRQVLVSGCEITDSAGEGIRIAASRQITLEGNRVAESRNHGIFVSWFGSVTREPQYVRVANNIVSGSKQAAGIGVGSGSNIEVTGNKVRDCYLSGILIYQHARVFALRSVRVAGNEVTHCAFGPLSYIRGGIAVFQMRNGQPNVVVEDNQVGDCAVGVWASLIGNDTTLRYKHNLVNGAVAGPVLEPESLRQTVSHLTIE